MAVERLAFEDLPTAGKAELKRSAAQQRASLENSAREHPALATGIHHGLELENVHPRAEILESQQEIGRLPEKYGRLEVENAELRGECKALSAATMELEGRLAQERASVERSLVQEGSMATRISAVLEPRIEQLNRQVSALQRENARLMSSSDRLRADNSEMISGKKAHVVLETELKAAMAALDALEKEKTEWYEPELARLKSHVEHSTFEKETQLLRRRVMAYADQSRRIAGAVVVLEARLAELEHLRNSWYVPELTRLSEIIEQYEKIKREWFEPQLESRASHIAELEEQVRIKDDLLQKLGAKKSVKDGQSDDDSEKPFGRIFRFKR